MKICVIGLGYVGLCQAVGLAKIGYDIIGVEINKENVDKINKKIPTIFEDGLKEILDETVPTRFTATTDMDQAIRDSDATFICVGTPSKKEGSMSLAQLEHVAQQIGPEIKKKKSKYYVVVKSTVVPGTCENVVLPILEKASGKKLGTGFGLAMNPEFLKEGTALEDFFNPDRVIIGSSDEDSRRFLKELYRSFKCPFLETSFSEAEMIKYGSNALLATKISFINELGNICKRHGINTNKVAEGMGLDRRIGPHFLRSGIGFGGSCFPKDVNALIYKATESGYNPRLLRSVLEVNRDQPLKLLELLEGRGLRGKKIGVLGLTFKAGTDDIRESPALNTIKELLMEESILYIYDPKAMDKVKKIFPHLSYVKSGQEAIDASEIVLILTEWPEFRDLDYKDKLVIDGKNVFDGKKPKNYEGICW